MPPQDDGVLFPKLILIYSMLFNSLANFYDLQPDGDDFFFVAVLPAGISPVWITDWKSRRLQGCEYVGILTVPLRSLLYMVLSIIGIVATIENNTELCT